LGVRKSIRAVKKNLHQQFPNDLVWHTFTGPGLSWSDLQKHRPVPRSVKEEPLGVAGETFYRPDALPVTIF